MYKQYLKVRNSKTGNGVFTTVQIPANAPILEFGGDFFTKENLKHPQDRILQIGKNLYLGPSGDVDDYINHSCKPNCYLSIIGKRAILYSSNIITIDSEITFDYSTSSTDSINEWSMNCLCGQPTCRKIISGFKYLSDDLKNHYRKNDMLPLFIK